MPAACWAEFDPADPSPLDAADEFGQLLHIAQDFYSHSNWVELGRTDLFEGGTGDWSVADDWKVLRDDIVVVSEDLPAGWTAANGANFVPDDHDRRRQATGLPREPLQPPRRSMTIASTASRPRTAARPTASTRTVTLPTKPLWAPARALWPCARPRTSSAACCTCSMPSTAPPVPATAMGLWGSRTPARRIPPPAGTRARPPGAGPDEGHREGHRHRDHGGLRRPLDRGDQTRLILFTVTCVNQRAASRHASRASTSRSPSPHPPR